LLEGEDFAGRDFELVGEHFHFCFEAVFFFDFSLELLYYLSLGRQLQLQTLVLVLEVTQLSINFFVLINKRLFGKFTDFAGVAVLFGPHCFSGSIVTFEFGLYAEVYCLQFIDFHPEFLPSECAHPVGSLGEGLDDDFVADLAAFVPPLVIVDVFPEDVDDDVLVHDLLVELLDEFTSLVLLRQALD